MFFSIELPGLFLALVVIIASAVMLWLTGLLVGGTFTMVVVGLALGYRRWALLLPISVVLPVVVWFALGRVAKISLPSGILWN